MYEMGLPECKNLRRFSLFLYGNVLLHSVDSTSLFYLIDEFRRFLHRDKAKK